MPFIRRNTAVFGVLYVSRMRIYIKSALKRISKEPFFLLALAATVIISFFSAPDISSIHWNVISTLFSLMLVCQAFEECSFLTAVAEAVTARLDTPRKLGLAMVGFTGLLSMFVTNDIALLTIVPLTIKIAKMSGRDPVSLVILETISANIFSACTPFGNPQNLYLFSYYDIAAGDFFGIMLPFFAAGAVLLFLLTMFICKGDSYSKSSQRTKLGDRKLFAGSVLAFAVNVLAVLRVLDYRISLAFTVVLILVLAPKLFLKADYILLATFVLFFLFTDALTAIPEVGALLSDALGSKTGVLLVSAGASQVISNVPAAVLLSVFTPHYRQLLYGVSAGGLGTLIASLASLISYKLYAGTYPARKYLKLFTVLNFSVLAVLLALLIIIG